MENCIRISRLGMIGLGVVCRCGLGGFLGSITGLNGEKSPPGIFLICGV